MASVKRLAYVQIEASDLVAWRRFGIDVLGCQAVAGDDPERLYLRIDDRPWRIQISSGPLDDIRIAGFEVDNQAEFETLFERLRVAGHLVVRADADACAARGVREMMCLDDPTGLALEISYGALLRPQDPCHLSVPHGGFITGDQGLGHLMLVVQDVEAVHRFYCELLGFVTSDYVSTTNYGGQRGDFIFMRCNPRHHSLAIGSLAMPRRLGHIMLEVRNFDDVGHALDRVHAEGFQQTRALGRHINDRMFSFYVASPSGLQFEYGWGGIEVNSDSGEVKTFEVTSVWGHQHLVGGRSKGE